MKKVLHLQRKCLTIKIYTIWTIINLFNSQLE